MAMNLGGFEKYSFIDYPGCISSVVFTMGCNFHCPYCHNPELVRPAGNGPASPVSEDDILSFLEKRRKYVDGVVITGGEPLLHPGLPEFCRKIKALGLLVKIDTNGSNPDMLADLIPSGLVDYLAMDIKTDPDRYVPLITDGIDPGRIRKSIATVIGSGLPHEFRTTCVQPIVDEAAMHVIAGLVQGASLYALQAFRNEKVLDPAFFQQHPVQMPVAALEAFKSILDPSVKQCIIR